MTATPLKHIVIAIDGPSGVGKSTAAKRLARVLGYRYVDSGAMYRAVGWVVHRKVGDLHDHASVAALLEQTAIDLIFADGHSEVWVEGENITEQLRGEAVGQAASAVATQPAVRRLITTRLRRLGCQVDLVMEGRDIGTVVFPDATVKFFLDASPKVRAQRRFQEMQQAGQAIDFERLRQAMATRDRQDQTRSMAPLARAPDAEVIDTTDLTVDDVVQLMLSGVHAKVRSSRAAADSGTAGSAGDA